VWYYLFTQKPRPWIRIQFYSSHSSEKHNFRRLAWPAFRHRISALQWVWYSDFDNKHEIMFICNELDYIYNLVLGHFMIVLVGMLQVSQYTWSMDWTRRALLTVLGRTTERVFTEWRLLGCYAVWRL
jgi:hypothetical protein